jgi:hypothetical protein
LALDQLHVSLDHLVKLVGDGGLEVLGDSQLMGFLQGFERLRNRLPLVDHAVIGAAVVRDPPGRLTQASAQRMLAAMLRISVPEAARRVRAAEALAERMSMTGEPLGPVRPHLAEADSRWQASRRSDPRHHGQRMHDALEDLCDRLLRTDNPVPDTGGTPATVIITIDHDDLTTNTGYGLSSDGTLIRTHTIRRLSDQADIYTAILTKQGQLLRLGRSRRIASRNQTIALYARDSGCSFPGCDTPPEWCERHHVIPWIDGGATDLDKPDPALPLPPPQLRQQRLALPHHHDGLPEWSPPWWIDHDRQPMINNRIQASIATRQHRRQ